MDKNLWHNGYVQLPHKDVDGRWVTGYVLQRKTEYGWEYQTRELTEEELWSWSIK